MIAQRSLHASHSRRKCHLDRGAAAVEMALVMPILVVMIVGIIDFSRVFNAELQLSQAAREGARLASLQRNSNSATILTADKEAIQDRAILAAPNPAFGAALQRNDVQVVSPYCVASSSVTDVATVTVTYTFSGFGPWLQNKVLKQTAVMICGG